jgi:AGCS family alanine or glycine:cation symporter
LFEWIESMGDALAETVNGWIGPAAKFMEGYVWGWPEKTPLLAIVLLGAGLYVTLRLAFVQIRGFKHGVDIARGVYDNPEDEGDLKHYQALTTALSATVGIGNIAGVAIAVHLGGPGALFWMWVTAFFGMALKYAECTLALKYREVHPDGSVSGGPMYYIREGLGLRFPALSGLWRVMAFVFAVCTMLASFGSGCMNQSNTLATRLNTQLGLPTVWSALIFATLVALVIIGGIRRIGRVTAILAPGMAIVYVGGALAILVVHFSQIPSGIAAIVTQAFSPEPAVGGAAGSLLITVMWGIRRGLFSNEAGQGSAPIAHATAKTKEPVREGLVASLGPFIDTLVICTMTGLVIVLTGGYLDKVEQRLPVSGLTAAPGEMSGDDELRSYLMAEAAPRRFEAEVRDGRLLGATFLGVNGGIVESAEVVGDEGLPWTGTLAVDENGSITVTSGSGTPAVVGGVLLTGADLTAHSFNKALGGAGNLIVTIAVVLFAVSTGISWSYYGDRATEYVFGSRAIPVYRWVFVVFFFLGCILPLEAVWTYGDVGLGLMSFPNLIALILLTGPVVAMTRDYFSRSHERFDG